MAHLRKHRLLERDEEHAIAVEFARTRDSALGARLVAANLRLVVKIAREYRRSNTNLLDLVQEGNMGLMHAVRKFDPSRGVKVSSYAAWWIRAYILKYILDNWRIVKVGTTRAQRHIFFNLRKERTRMEHSGNTVDTQRLSAALRVRESELVEMEGRMNSSDATYDAFHAEGAGGQVGPRVPPPEAEAMRPDVAVEASQFQAALRAALGRFSTTLPDRESFILRSRLWCDQPMTLDQIGARFGVSRERARQVELRLKKWLRVYLDRELGLTQPMAERAA